MSDARSQLIDGLAEQLGVAALSPAEVNSVLDLAAAAAHGTGDRTSAPLVSFLAGLAAGGSEDRGGVLSDVAERTVQLTAPEG